MKDELDPRQASFLQYYLDPKSETFSNGYGSAIKAGYGEGYAQQITAREPAWLEIVKDWELLKKAEKNLKEFLEHDTDDKIRADMTKFVLERLHKKKYSARTEVEHSGEIAEKQRIELDEKTNKLLEDFIKWREKNV